MACIYKFYLDERNIFSNAVFQRRQARSESCSRHPPVGEGLPVSQWVKKSPPAWRKGGSTDQRKESRIFTVCHNNRVR